MAKLMSMTDGGCPSAIAKFTNRPSPSTKIRWPVFSLYSSTSLRTFFVTPVDSSFRATRSSSMSKWPRVAHDRAVLHRPEVLPADDVLVARHRDEHVADLGRVGHRHHHEPVHRRLQGRDRVHFRHDHLSTQTPRPQGHALAAPAVAAHDHLAAGHQDVRRPDDAVDGALAGAVAVVEHVLRRGVVHRDDRELEDAVLLHRPQPDDAGRRLLHAADDLVDGAWPARPAGSSDAHARTCACTSSSRSRATNTMRHTKSAPSSMVTFGSNSSAATTCL